MNKKRIAINGFGRIGRAFFKIALNDPECEIIAVNDLMDPETLLYLLNYDSVYGGFMQGKITLDGADLVTPNGRVKLLQEKEPTKLPWRDLKIDVVVESTGLYTNYDKAQFHIDQGANHVLITGPVKGESAAKGITALAGINFDQVNTCSITSNASCTTNSASPIITILDESIGIEKAILSTVHAYTATQSIVDGGGKKDKREMRAAAQNIIPSTTGAAIAVTEVHEPLKGKFDGISLRVPVVAGSIADITFIAKRSTSVEEVQRILVAASQNPRWEGIFTASNAPLVSTDIIGSPYASIADLQMVKVVDGNLVKVLAWYDNEMGYTHTLLRHVKAITSIPRT